MSTDAAKPPPQANVSIESVLGVQQHNLWQRIAGAQSFWVTIALILICLVMSYLQPASFATTDNFFNITRNFSFIGIMALGMTAVIATGGIDLSVGSIMGLTAVASGLTLEAGYPAWAAIVVGLSAGAVTGLINGLIIAYAGISPFVTTLGMLAIARSCAVVLSGNRMIYKFGPGGPAFKALGSGAVNIGPTLQLSYPLLFLVVLTALLAIVYKMTSWGRHVLAIGGNEHAALLTGVPVNRIKVRGLCRLGPRRVLRGDPGCRLGGIGDQRARCHLRTSRDLGRGHRRRESHGGRSERLRRLHRRGADFRHPQFAFDGGRRFELARHVRRPVPHRSSLSR